ncbi:hypothetical protein KI387_039706, partial [Taxus chinensis]
QPRRLWQEMRVPLSMWRPWRDHANRGDEKEKERKVEQEVITCPLQEFCEEELKGAVADMQVKDSTCDGALQPTVVECSCEGVRNDEEEVTLETTINGEGTRLEPRKLLQTKEHMENEYKEINEHKETLGDYKEPRKREEHEYRNREALEIPAKSRG